MPSKTPKQKRFMQAAAHDPKFAAQAGIKQSVAQEFVVADKKRGPAPSAASRKAKFDKS